MQAYLDISNEVIATSAKPYTLAQAQLIQPLIVSLIANAPPSLVVKGRETAERPYHHQFSSGDGTLLSHYVEVEVLKPLKLARGAEIDARTEELISAGFVASNTRRFRIDDGALARYQAMHTVRNEVTVPYPLTISVYENDGIVQGLPNAAAVNSFVTEMFLGHVGIVKSGEDLKALITAAATKAEIDAIVDTR